MTINKLKDPNRHKRAERERRRNAGFVLKQVWVHKEDMELFTAMVDTLPNNSLYEAPTPKRKPKMPGMS